MAVHWIILLNIPNSSQKVKQNFYSILVKHVKDLLKIVLLILSSLILAYNKVDLIGPNF